MSTTGPHEAPSTRRPRPRLPHVALWRGMLSLSRRRPLPLALLVFGLGVGASFGAWHITRQQLERNWQAEFDFEARQAVRRLEERMGTYEQVERDTQAFLLGSMKVTRADFQLFTNSIKLEQRFPGIQGLALAEYVTPAQQPGHEARIRGEGLPGYAIRPAGPRPFYGPIAHIEPMLGLNLRAPGFDMLTDPVRRRAMELARDTGEAAASGKVRLIQENGRNVQSGFVMYIPVYRRGMPVDTVAQRRAELVGWVGAPFRMDDLMAGLERERAGEVTLAIYDGAGLNEADRLFDGPALARAAGKLPPRFTPRYDTLRQLAVGGRPWTLDIRSSPQFEQRLDGSKPHLIGLIGGGASFLVALLVWILATGRRRAIGLAGQMTRQLSASEYRWKYALEGAGDGVWDWNRGNDEVAYSQRWKAMLGYGEGEVPGTLDSWRGLLHPDDVAATQAIVAAYVESTSAHYEAQFRMRCRDGSYRWVLARGMAVTRDAHGHPLRTIGTHADITRAKENEAAMLEANLRLASERQRFNVILQNSHDAFVAVSAAGVITDWNASAESMFGWSAADAVGRNVADLLAPASRPAAAPGVPGGVAGAFAGLAAAGPDRPVRSVVEVQLRHRNGRLIPAEVAVANFPEGAGLAISAFIRDISERKDAERSAQERGEALETARAALQHAQKLEAVGKLTGGVAHDFNNVLQVINGNVQLLQLVPPGQVGQPANADKLRQRLRSIAAAVEKGAKLSSQLLAFARRQPLQPVALNPLRIVQNRDDLLQRALGETIRIDYQCDRDLWNISVDPGQLENVVVNLAINARDAMAGQHDGVFTIVLQNRVLDAAAVENMADVRPGDYVLLAVSDTGSGMSAAVLAVAFEPFFTTKPVGQGTGLGLSMAYGFVKQSGGHIALRSAPGEGTTVEILLPRSREPEVAVPLPVVETVAGGNETILVVEDDMGVRLTAVATLAGLGYDVLHAVDGASALALLEGGARVDLLFTDVVMPGPVSSTELADHARRLLPGVAVLFTSGYTRDALLDGGRLRAGVQLLGKPYQRTQLAHKVRETLSGRSLPSE
jgi:PAS domain S-box-containing protein